MLELGTRLTLGDPVSAVVSLLFKSMVLFVDENNYILVVSVVSLSFVSVVLLTKLFLSVGRFAFVCFGRFVLLTRLFF